MGFSNNMTLLVNKIEARLGLDMLDLPEKMTKDKWPDKIIIPDTLTTWSRYYPNEFRYHITPEHKQKNGWYLLDESAFQDCTILGVKNLDWTQFNSDTFGSPYGVHDYLAAGFDVGDMVGLIGQANVNSLFNNGIYPVFDPPNKFRLESTYGARVELSDFWVLVLIKHSPNLTSISATQMETFEALAQADVANWLYQHLKMFQDLQTVYASVNLRLDELQAEGQKRDDIINTIKESYVSASNKNQPMMFCI